MFRVAAPFQHLTQKAREAQEEIVRSRRELLESLGVTLLDETRETIEVRSTGGAAAGIGWQPLNPVYLKRKQREGWPSAIGVATGELFQSAESQVGPGGVAVEFTAAHAPDFERLRPLLPADLPAEWAEDLEAQTEAWGEIILNETLTEDR